MRVGFTGTQKGMTDQQRESREFLLKSSDLHEFHHGDCVGADAEAHAIASQYASQIESHPGHDAAGKSPKRAFCGSFPCLQIHDPMPYLLRNEVIVDAADLLIATPKGFDEEFRNSGTWATVRYASRKNKPVLVIWPDGQVEPWHK